MTPTPIFLMLWPEWSESTLCLLAGSFAVSVMLLGRKGLQGTTMAAPWCWALGSLVVLTLTELAAAVSGSSASESSLGLLRYAAAVTTFCPQMAVLGAKRPQDRAWQWIVLSLLVVLWLPAAQWGLFHGGEPLNLATAWSGLLVILMLVGWVNYLPTRYWLSSGLVFLGQLGLLLPYLSETSSLWPVRGVGLTLMAVAVVLVASGFPRARRADGPLDRLWIDFRDQFGVVWGLRIAERLRTETVKNVGEAEIDWTGIHLTSESEETGELIEEAVTKSLRSLLGRFVSPQWIAARLPGS